MRKILVVLLTGFTLTLLASENYLENPGFEETTASGEPGHWLVKYELPSDEKITVTEKKTEIRAGKHSLRYERYNDKSPLKNVQQSVNLDFAPGEGFEFGGWIKCLEYLGGESAFMVGIIDGANKKYITSNAVSGMDWTLSAASYRFKSKGQIRYFAITFRPPKRIKNSRGEEKLARGIFLYDDLFLKKINYKSGEDKYDREKTN